MKPGLRWIPTEVWVDVLCLPWISRKELGRIVDQFRNAYFVEILQYCLHERGKRTLGDMHLDEKLWPYIIPQTPMPDNIKFFNFIIFSHFDSRTIDFLRSISTLFTGVNMTLDDLPPAELRTVLEHLSPLIHGIHSLTLDQWAIPLMEEYFAPKLAQIKMLKIAIDSCHSQPTIDFALNWLTSGGQRDQIEPKVLKLHIPLLKDVQQFIVAILKQFHSAKSLSTFAIQFKIWRAPIADFDLENSLGEQLRGQCDSDREHFQISRHQPNAGKAVQEWVQETVQKSRRSSCLAFYDLTIGPLDANAGDNGNGMNIVEAEADQPSTSGCSIN